MMLTVARTTDLGLPEFAAFNEGRQYSRMRRWELPFAMFNARLPTTGAVLDCTINPERFHEPLQQLYPHLLYRHWNPLQNGRFLLPEGLPDEAFDRVLCINTLEHLLAEQRSALLAELARKLTPGGLLVVTCDYYFDDFWQREELLRMGVVRADRAELLGGWNLVTPEELLGRASEVGLRPFGALSRAPDPTDPSLYRNVEPFPHATIGAVLVKGDTPALPPSRRIALALLTWNTCAISLESLQASVREAQMLERCGHLPLVLVCDNGSTDGTADELRRLQGCLNVPHLFILNHDNLGNSIARNQLIAAMRQHNADYLLFMDGDIEIVPGSSLAMLRYMENYGGRLGCIGVNSSWQTPERARATPALLAIDETLVQSTNLVAWTQYGMFRRAVFEDGVAFDETEPFDQAGWGFEDNDLAFQMEMRGYRNRFFSGMVYLHRAVHSSIRIMRQHGLRPEELYARRKQYVITKWASVPQINTGPLEDVRRVAMPRS